MSTREMAYSVIDAMTEEQLKAFLMLFGNYKEPNQETLDAIEESDFIDWHLHLNVIKNVVIIYLRRKEFWNMLSQEQIDMLLNILKKIKYDKENFYFPETGNSKQLEAVSYDNKYKFLIDIKPGRTERRKKQLTLQERYNKDVILLRLDLNGPPHTNPDGKQLSGNHLHIIKEGYNDRFAYEIPDNIVDEDDRLQTLINFLEYCKIENPIFTNMERRLFYE